jgi:hypothetical protein
VISGGVVSAEEAIVNNWPEPLLGLTGGFSLGVLFLMELNDAVSARVPWQKQIIESRYRNTPSGAAPQFRMLRS